ncbi:hypothetical protein TNCV_3946601 [Trichonephila clavipes]|nr:hypothetical protein TNCV_3946601 [Trichonephila clavipes]
MAQQENRWSRVSSVSGQFLHCKYVLVPSLRIFISLRWGFLNLQVSEFDRGRIIARRERGLPIQDIVHRTGQNPTTVVVVVVRFILGYIRKTRDR